MPTKRALVLYSGGLDSAVCLAMAVADPTYKDVHALVFSYNQSNSNEIQAACELLKNWKVPYNVQTLQVRHHDAHKEIPGRNTLFLAKALERALIDKYDTVVIGAEPDATYIDSSHAYLLHIREVFRLHGVELIYPVKFFENKKAIILKALDLGIPLDLLHPSRSNVVDGKCSTSKSFIIALGDIFPSIDFSQLITTLISFHNSSNIDANFATLRFPGLSFKVLPATFLLGSMPKTQLRGRSFKVSSLKNWGEALNYVGENLALNMDFYLTIVRPTDLEILSRNSLNTDSAPSQWGIKQALSRMPRPRYLPKKVYCQRVQGHLQDAIEDLGYVLTNHWSDPMEPGIYQIDTGEVFDGHHKASL